MFFAMGYCSLTWIGLFDFDFSLIEIDLICKLDSEAINV